MSTANTKTVEEGQIRAVIEDWANALRAKDADRLVSQYTTESVKFILAPPLQYTRDNPFDKKSLEEWFSSFQGPIQYQNRDLNITAGGQSRFLP
jgi:PhnB protein